GQNPQDIEWAFDGTHLWLLQARPVTNLPRVGWPETAAQPRYWSTANIKDVAPSVVCELSWSLLTEFSMDANYASHKAVGYDIPPGLQAMRRFHGRGYFDLTAGQWAAYDAFGTLPSQFNPVAGGHQPEIVVPPGRFRSRSGPRRAAAGL